MPKAFSLCRFRLRFLAVGVVDPELNVQAFRSPPNPMRAPATAHLELYLDPNQLDEARWVAVSSPFLSLST